MLLRNISTQQKTPHRWESMRGKNSERVSWLESWRFLIVRHHAFYCNDILVDLGMGDLVSDGNWFAFVMTAALQIEGLEHG
jgi:hypothetical protein